LSSEATTPWQFTPPLVSTTLYPSAPVGGSGL
jgi:hypothetical protein